MLKLSAGAFLGPATYLSSSARKVDLELKNVTGCTPYNKVHVRAIFTWRKEDLSLVEIKLQGMARQSSRC